MLALRVQWVIDKLELRYGLGLLLFITIAGRQNVV
jgi:hypothetical protein